MATITTNVLTVHIETSDKVLLIATYLLELYQSSHREEMDEMKFHKLMYFAQRESFIQGNKPLFNATFYGWKNGPVLKEIRSIYKEYREGVLHDVEVSEYEDEVLQITLRHYGESDPWELCSLSCGEMSWQKSRVGVPSSEKSGRPINTDDIAIDAKRVKAYRESNAPILVM